MKAIEQNIYDPEVLFILMYKLDVSSVESYLWITDEIQKSDHFMKAVELTVTVIPEPSGNFRKLVLCTL